MDPNLLDFLKQKTARPESSNENKVMDLASAVRSHVRPGMSIHAGNGMGFPTAAYYEIARQFWGKDPGFTLIGVTGGAYSFSVFAHGRLCRRIISGFNGDGYPFPTPNPILTRAFSEGLVIPESWSHLTLTLRLMAGAMGLPFFPTKSLKNSSMEIENREYYCQAPDPFAAGESVGLVKALNPDLSLVHALAADAEGNAILAAPYSANHYGALAAKEGAIVTAEKIVGADFLRRYSYMAQVPGYVVRAVCPVPFGAHPVGLPALGVPEIDGYGEDEEFIQEARRSSRDRHTYQSWVDKWVLECRNHCDFLSRLGQKRIWHLMGRINRESWSSELAEAAERLPYPELPTPAERLVIGASQKIREIIGEKKYRLILCGIGVSNLASWTAYYALRHAGTSVDLAAETGFYGYSPQPADPFLFNLRNLPSCLMINDIFTTLGIFISGYNASSLGILGAGQIDRFGNVNTTKVSLKGDYMVGSGGGNDVASGACEVMITLEQNKDRFVEKVPYITSPGHRVSTVVSQYGIFEKAQGLSELALTGYFIDPSVETEEEMIRIIRDQCGWPLKISRTLRKIPSPSADEIKFLRCFDPRRLYLGGPESKRQ
jgi:acyl CoA:acetate/3-ketoacid CoA transferase alpha subunit/acyl CoA:acetate/3-ketoacid CoA transferase beta subunit